MRIPVSILAIFLCLFLIQASARFGLSRLFARGAIITNSRELAGNAIFLSPSDPDAYRARAVVLKPFPELAGYALDRAAGLRYRDDSLWIELAQTREELGDMNGALAALDQAVLWAPYYAHTHWQRGNVLLRMGRTADAFTELRVAAKANSGYLQNVIDLAWGVSRGDLKSTEDLLQISNDNDRVVFIRYLATRGKGIEVMQQLRQLSTPLSAEQSKELVRLLVAAKDFRPASEIVGITTSIKFSDATLVNGGFEEPLVLDDGGFGWLVSSEQGKNRLAIDVSEKLEGAKSLQISLDGNWTPGTPLLSQTLIVEPQKTYRISFAVKTKDLVTGGPPLLTVSDAGNNQLLGKSTNLPGATNPWVTLNFEFTTLPASQAAIIRLQRNNCDSSPCPIFGTLWLDQFRVEQIAR